ncbi:DUF2334 domain-containing protein [uncultured Winogradskyella sp.]|uniref:DUF2334 domain-containing protein n=1 Tax=uncultured Winogradskyella sp. TaxID=395353 RepID=UPI002633B2B0|nr:DUF2334 domain-containing protein [uncultured Winogradskyella sp.]
MKIKFIISILLGCSLLLNASVYNCKTTDDIISALKTVKAGDEIIIEPGTYIKKSLYKSAYFYSDANGTLNSPIVIKSSSELIKPKLQGNDIKKGAVLRIIGDNWVIENLDFSVGLKGLVLDNSNNSTIINCNVHKIGNEAIHVRDGSDFTVINNCKIYNTGNENSGYGEGIYIGTDRKGWDKFNPNCDNTVIKNCEIGPSVRAEAIDIKEGTQNTTINNNIFNGEGISGSNSASSFISVKGAKTNIFDNVFYANNELNLSNAITAVFRDTPLSGYESCIYNNIFNMDGVQGNMVQANNGTSDICAWDNVRNPKGNNYSKKVLNYKPTWYNNEEVVVYEDNFDAAKFRFLGSALKNINISAPKKGEVKLEMKPGTTLPPYSPIMYRFPSAIDFSKSLKIVVRVKSSESFKLRFDLHDGNKATNGKNGRVSQTIPSGLDKWTDLEFTYSDVAFLDNRVNKSGIERINIQLDSGKENFPSALYIDFIRIIETSTSRSIPTNDTKESTKVNKHVILKMDDLRANKKLSYNDNWQRFVNTIRNHKIKAALGIVGEDLPKASNKYKDSLMSWHSSENFEIWHHGWDHKRKNHPPENSNVGEFSGTPYGFQKEHFERSIKYAKSELGIDMKTFGAPFNQTDETFAKVLEENPEIKVWLYGKKNTTYSGLVLSRGAKNRLESSTGVVSFESFLTAYESSKTPYIVLQGHPGKWDEQSFIEFDKVIQYLKKIEVTFMLPYQYYEELNKKIN